MSGGLGAALVATRGTVLAQETAPAPGNEVVALPAMQVDETAIEQDYWPEEAEVPAVFRKRGAGLFGRVVLDDEASRDELAVVGEQVAALTVDFSPGEFATVSGAETPRGFTTPRLRNGLSQSGFPEIILGGRRELLTGFLATYYGRTAPGGIQNHVSRRPATKPTHQVATGFTAGPATALRLSGERNAALVPKRLHYRATGEVRWTDGPQDHAWQEIVTAGVGLRYAPGKNTVWLVEVEGTRVAAQPSGGVPLERAARGAVQGAPHAPLATFNTNGPNASSRRTSGSASVLLEHKAQDDLTLRGGAQLWRRKQRELRFNTGAFLLDEGIFDGVREPQYSALEQSAAGVELALDGHGTFKFADHQWMIGAFASREQSDREQRALPTAVRNALPAAVRLLDPAAPDWTLPAYSPELYARLLALRDEGAEYFGVFWSERVAFAGDRVFATFGMREDWVRSHVDDLRSGASVPHAQARVNRATYHAGVVWHAVPNRLAGFLNRSTAFQPARRVDARTGRIIGNEGTSGVEVGLRYASADNRLAMTWSAYRLWNENITRTNPFYNDPVHDPERRQPQFVSSGEERFTGTEIGVRHNGGGGLTWSGKAAWVEAITTSSPDLPEEVGRQLARLPEFTGGASARYAFRAPKLRGLTFGAGYAWIGRHVAVYENSRRAPLAYGSYGVLSFNAGFSWQKEKRQHSLSLALRNAFDKDLIAAAGRVGGDRAADAGYSVRF